MYENHFWEDLTNAISNFEKSVSVHSHSIYTTKETCSMTNLLVVECIKGRGLGLRSKIDFPHYLICYSLGPHGLLGLSNTCRNQFKLIERMLYKKIFTNSSNRNYF